tara:strand:+ start:558 stop:1022 length:465 start_codon:yes stop_codon:yes gene_type:complete
MLSKELIINIVEEFISINKLVFLVGVKYSRSNDIEVLIDSFEGISIAECASLSRYIESSLDRDKFDYSLQVASAGLNEPFKVFKQYKKSIGKEVSVYLKGGQKILGKIIDANEGKGINLETVKLNKKGKKKIQTIDQQFISFNQIDKAKIVISF